MTKCGKQYLIEKEIEFKKSQKNQGRKILGLNFISY